MISSQTGWGEQKAGTARHAFLSTSPLRVTATTAVHRIGYRHRQQSVVCPQVQMPAAHPIHPDRNRIPCPIIPPGRTGKRLFANLSPPASHPPWAMPCCARAWFPRAGSPLATGPNSSFRCPRPRQAAKSRNSPSRINAADTRPCLRVQCVPSHAAPGGDLRAVRLVNHSQDVHSPFRAQHPVHYCHPST